jgi:hypothetical protein
MTTARASCASARQRGSQALMRHLAAPQPRPDQQHVETAIGDDVAQVSALDHQLGRGLRRPGVGEQLHIACPAVHRRLGGKLAGAGHRPADHADETARVLVRADCGRMKDRPA